MHHSTPMAIRLPFMKNWEEVAEDRENAWIPPL